MVDTLSAAIGGFPPSRQGLSAKAYLMLSLRLYDHCGVSAEMRARQLT